MDIRYSTGKEPFKRMDTDELRDEFLIAEVFREDDVTAVYSHIDRIVTMGAMPVHKELPIDKNIDCWKNFGVDYLLERRELGAINIGGKGTIKVDGTEYPMEHFDGIYIPMGTKEVILSSASADDPAKFYMCTTPAHRPYPIKLSPLKDAIHKHLGSQLTSNERTINQYIHPDVLDTCQLSMGLTQLAPGSNWNTMPCHTHERRMEVYTYFEVPDDQVVFHMMGEPNETRHIVMKNFDAVISPSWSIHSGVGTSNYTFIWAMVGENMEYDDMDVIDTPNLK